MESEDALEELAIREEYRDAFREEMSEIGQSFVVFMIGKVRTVAGVGDRKISSGIWSERMILFMGL